MLKRSLLDSILSQPSAPFREGHVIRLLTETLTRGKVPHFIDPIGNIVVGAKDRHSYQALLRKKGPEPLRIFIAHMDHPGFHGERWEDNGDLAVRWHGGSATAHLEGAPVWLASREGWLPPGVMTEAKMIPSGKAIEAGVVRPENAAELRKRFPDARDIFGSFGFRAPVWQEGDLIYTKAADDLVGCFAIVSTALDLWAKKSAPRSSFLAILTRAEEVGFIGAIGHFELGWLAHSKRPLLAVSLETSRTLPGADIGKGPVVRLGDRFTVFDAGALRIFTQLAEKHLPEKHQRRIMDGGSCEATAATVYGIPSVGVSVPLGNYHNQSFEGGPDSRGPLGPAPEFVHLEDVEGLLTLCQTILTPKQPWKAPWESRRKDFKKAIGKYRGLVKSKP